ACVRIGSTGVECEDVSRGSTARRSAQNVAAGQVGQRCAEAGANARGVGTVTKASQTIRSAAEDRVRTALREQSIFRTNVSGCRVDQQSSIGEQSAHAAGWSAVRGVVAPENGSDQVSGGRKAGDVYIAARLGKVAARTDNGVYLDEGPDLSGR